MSASAMVALTACALGLAPAVRQEWARVEPGLELSYPRDHGAHPAYRTEWWYVTGLVQDAGGARFGFQLTVFRQGLDPSAPRAGESPLRAREILAGHLALTDVAARRTRFAERLRRAGSPLAVASTSDLDLAVEDWSLRRDDGGRLALAAADPVQGFGLRLELAPEKPLVLHGDRGVSKKGEAVGNASAYASWTRLAVEGELDLDGDSREVRGEAWFDHEFGSSVLGEGVVGWDWFGLRLADGRDLMCFALRGEDGSVDPASGGTLVERDGTPRALGRGEVTVEATERWRSERTQALYPSAWRIAVPACDLALEARALVPDCELASTGSTGVVYWEGPVAVTGSVAGEGFAELTGYAGSMKGRF